MSSGASKPPSYHGDANQEIAVEPQQPHANDMKAVATVDEYEPEARTASRAPQATGQPPKFRLSSLWKREEVNPLNGKAMTLPLFRIISPYSIAFWMATLGFFVAFLSWFAFSPLTPETVKADLKLTAAEVANSNIVALAATLVIRFVAGPLVDRYGPRKVMAALLVLGAIPSGLAGTAHDAGSLYTLRFFIGILGGTFVPCQAWTTAWFDKSIVGTVNALSGGWGNLGGGVTFGTQTGLFQRLTKSGLSQHIAWRVCFVIVPVPCLLLVAGAMMLFAKDHPAGKWSQRHQLPAIEVAMLQGHQPQLAHDEICALEQQSNDSEKAMSDTGRVASAPLPAQNLTPTDVAVSEPITLKVVGRVIADPRTWLAALAYASTFGLELAMDANLANVYYGLFKSPTFQQLDAGYLASMYGLLNLFARVLGGYGSDLIYRRWGIQGKKWWLLSTAFVQGILLIGVGVYIEKGSPSLGGVVAFVVFIAISGFMANGANYALVPHLNPYSNGLMSGIVGGMGNAGGIIYAVIFRFHDPANGSGFWISGVLCAGINVLLAFIPLGDLQ